jgi:hypothetical protein
MIFDELNTSFRFYDDLDKQNRYKENCASVCEYKLLSPIDTILPFQFKVGYEPSLSLSSAYVRCEEDDSIVVDISVYLSLNFNSTTSFIYVTGEELSLKDAIPCGSYYLHLVLSSDSGEYNYYSEIFISTDLVASITPFAQSIFSLPCAWKWYNNVNKLIQNSSPCDKLCVYSIVCGNDALIPFQYKVSSATSVTNWSLVNEDCSFILDASLLEIQTVGSVKNIIYKGDLIDLPCGTFYSEMVIDGVTHYSEPIKITNDFQTASTNYILQETGDLLLQENNSGLLQ